MTGGKWLAGERGAYDMDQEQNPVSFAPPSPDPLPATAPLVELLPARSLEQLAVWSGMNVQGFVERYA